MERVITDLAQQAGQSWDGAEVTMLPADKLSAASYADQEEHFTKGVLVVGEDNVVRVMTQAQVEDGLPS